jgi:hypothetical protein
MDSYAFMGKRNIVVGGVYVTYKVAKNLIEQTRLDPNTRDNKQEEDGWNTQYTQDNAKKPATLRKGRNESKLQMQLSLP